MAGEAGAVKILNCFLENRPGGANMRGYRIALRLREHGIETCFLFNEKQPGVRPFPDFDCLLFRRLQAGQAPNRIGSTLAFLAFLPINLLRLIRTIRRYRFDVIHVNGMINVVPALAAVLTRTRLLWHLNDMSVPRVLAGFLSRLVRRWSWRIGLCARALGGAYFADDPVAHRKFVDLVPPVETDIWRPEAIAPEILDRFRDQFGLAGHHPIIAAVGNINPAKGYEYFVEMAHLLHRQFPSAVFVVAGARLDSQRKYAEAIDQQIRRHNLSEAFRFLGYCQDIRIVLAACDVFVLSSVREGNPTVVLEAMSMRRPIVATEVGGVREQIDDGESGIVVPPRDGGRLAEGVRRILTMTPESRIRMVEAARSHVQQVYDIQRVTRDYLRLFDSLSSEPHRG
jgi:glycosyltransferase involved in cell wall biosynthesis